MASAKKGFRTRTALLGGLLLAVPAFAQLPPGSPAQEAAAASPTMAPTHPDTDVGAAPLSLSDTAPIATHLADTVHPDDVSTNMIALDPATAAEAALPAVVPQSLWRERISVHSVLGTGPNGNLEGDRVLRLVVRSNTGKLVAAKVGLSIGMALLGGGVYGDTGRTFSKGNLKGKDVDSLPSPAYGVLPDLIRARLETYFAAHPSALPAGAKEINASSGEWSLVYQKLSDAATPYELRHDVKIAFPVVRSFLRHSGGEGIHCRSEAVVAPLAEWQQDDYALVKQTALKYAEQCADTFAEQLPVLFPDQPGAAATVVASASVESAPQPASDATEMAADAGDDAVQTPAQPSQ